MNEEQQIVAGIMCEQMEPPIAVEQLNREATLADLGLNSLKFMLVIIEIEHRLEKSIFKVELMPELKTVGDVLDLVA
ncbi:acyl carrier protein [Aliikangiella maris]|uniref:Acyl carrier protein n=2 Tax=Aliikangiella maris TaxID=3162458 RepID=A0ABV2BPS2_9GAMM